MLFSTSIFFNHERRQDPGVLPYIYVPYRYVPPQREGFFGPFCSESTLPILVWSRVWFSRKLRERTCMNVFIVSIPNE